MTTVTWRDQFHAAIAKRFDLPEGSKVIEVDTETEDTYGCAGSCCPPSSTVAIVVTYKTPDRAGRMRTKEHHYYGGMAAFIDEVDSVIDD